MLGRIADRLKTWFTPIVHGLHSFASLTLNERLTFVIGACSVVVAIGALIVGYQTLKVTSDSRVLEEAVAQLASIAKKTNEQADALNRQVATLKDQFNETRNHDRKAFHEAATFLMEFGDPREVGIYIENNGQGPAYIMELRIYMEGRQLNGASEIWKSWKTMRPLKRGQPSYHEFSGGRYIRAGEKWSLFYTDRSNVSNMTVFRTSVNDKVFMIGSACDLYSQCRIFCTRALLPDACRQIENELRRKTMLPPPRPASQSARNR